MLTYFIRFQVIPGRVLKEDSIKFSKVFVCKFTKFLFFHNLMCMFLYSLYIQKSFYSIYIFIHDYIQIWNKLSFLKSFKGSLLAFISKRSGPS